MPSKSVLEAKQQIVEELTEKIRSSVSGVVVNYQGITVEDDTKLRKAMREAGITYRVVKNSLTGMACANCGYEGIKQYLSGMTAIAVSPSDAVAPAKILKEYADKIESFKILAGYVEDREERVDPNDEESKTIPKTVYRLSLFNLETNAKSDFVAEL